MYYYWAFGLHIAAEIAFPELMPATFTTPPDLLIKKGKVPEQLSGADVVHKVNLSISPTEYLQDLPVAKYYAADGNRIVVEPKEQADEKSVRLFLLSNAMAAILHQQNKIPIHASAIYYKNGIVLFIGPSGAGKSTIVTALQSKGYKVFSDDVCVLQNDTHGNLVALPSYPMIKLWEDSFAKVGLALANEADKIRPHLAKYARFYHDDFEIAAKPVLKLFILQNDPAITIDDVAAVPLKPLVAFRILQRNTYRHVQVNVMKKGKHISTSCTDLPI